MTRLAPVLACTLIGLAAPAHATVDAMIPAIVIAKNVQTEGYCYLKVPMAAEVGIPVGEMIAATLSPHWALRNRSTAGGFAELTTIRGKSYVNLNEIAVGTPLKHTYLLDEYKGTTFIYRAELDASDLAAKNGTTLAGRRATILKTKLALLAIAKDMALVAGAGNPWQLHLTIKGLPSQSGLTGTPLYATTSWPYTAGSSLLAKYAAELIRAGDCGSFGKTDEVLGTDEALGSAASPLEESAGCAAVPGRSGARVGVLVLLGLGLLLLRARRRA